ncbi:hypothetical protein T459_27906 [Capsicum annuum]|uniref:Uncharacterized protein n=1 Tax=Capsicum annuum TaxID=4072 RepID=A0A2G2YFD2_CAPAN|nr:hypothetical protein T459_27906 [Capsicum annuum]
MSRIILLMGLKLSGGIGYDLSMLHEDTTQNYYGCITITMKLSGPSGRAKTGAELMISESLKYDFEMVCMIILTARIDQNIIYEDYDEHVQVLLEHLVHQVHESGWGISKTEGHDQKLEVTISSMKISLQNVIFFDFELMIVGSEVCLREIAGTLKLVE